MITPGSVSWAVSGEAPPHTLHSKVTKIFAVPPSPSPSPPWSLTPPPFTYATYLPGTFFPRPHSHSAYIIHTSCHFLQQVFCNFYPGNLSQSHTSMFMLSPLKSLLTGHCNYLSPQHFFFLFVMEKPLLPGSVSSNCFVLQDPAHRQIFQEGNKLRLQGPYQP